MNILDLPIEIGVLIYSYLDTKSKINVHKSCKELRIFFAPCHLKSVCLSRSSVGTEKTLREALFFDYGDYIQELNLSGLPELTVTLLKPHLERLKNLKCLDITFTDIYLSDFIEIFPKTLSSISVNFFKFPRKSRRCGDWDKCKKIFKQKQFHLIHFVVFEFLDSDTPLMFLKNLPSAEDLKITVADNYRDFWEIDDEDTSQLFGDYGETFSKLTYVFRDCRVTHKTSRCLRGVSNLNYQEIEYIFIMYLEKIVVHVSPIFHSFFSVHCSDLTLEICNHLPLNFMLDGNIIFKAWSKLRTNFNEEFFNNLLLEFRNYFPTYICMHNNIRMKILKSPCNWYCIDGCEGFENLLDDLPSNVTLTDFCRKDGAVIRSHRPVSLSPAAKSLQNLTYLRLSNICLKGDFFPILFSRSKRLTTLDIYVEKRGRLAIFRGCTLSLSKSIHLTKSLKNLKLTSEDIEYELLFDTLSRCPSLENVHICEYERALGDNKIKVNNVFTLIENCKNLYSLFIEADMSPEDLTLLMSPLREAAQVHNRDHLSIEVCDCYRGWNPFVDVFNPSPLHILD